MSNAGVIPDALLDIGVMLNADAAGVESFNCSDGPAWVAIDTPDGIRAERLPACNPRHYDPGWRVS
jgi:hypothetical protein